MMTNEELMALPMTDELLDKCAAAFVGELEVWGIEMTPCGTRFQIGRWVDGKFESHGLSSAAEADKLYEAMSHRAAARAFIEAYEKRDQ